MSLTVVRTDEGSITVMDGKEFMRVPRDVAPKALESLLVKGRYQGAFFPCLRANGQLNANLFPIHGKLYYCNEDCQYSEVYCKATAGGFQFYVTDNLVLALGEKSFYNVTQLHKKGYLLLDVTAFSSTAGRVIVCVQGTKTVPSDLNWVYNEVYLLDKEGLNLLYATNDSRFLEKSKMHRDVPENDCSFAACKQRVLNAQIVNELLKFDFVKVDESTFTLGGLVFNLGK